MELNHIYQGDCLEIMKTFPDNSVDLLLTDPPYFLPAKHYATRKDFSRSFSDLGILESFFRNFFQEAKRVMKPTGRIYMFCDGQSYPMFYYHIYLFSKSVRPLIWDKKVSINGYHWRHQHELILFAEMPQSKPVPTGDGDILRYSAVKVDLRQHPAEKPIKILTALISKSTQKDDVVLDPFIGSGSVAIACKDLGRKYIGIELDRKYHKIAEKRLKEVL